jgi:hypothetical protein
MIKCFFAVLIKKLNKEGILFLKIILCFLKILPEFPFRWLRALWIKKPERLPFCEKEVFFIFCHTFCLDAAGEMTEATKNGLIAAAQLCKIFLEAIIVFDYCSFPKDRRWKEDEIKEKFLAQLGVAPERIRRLGPVANTVEEVIKGKALLAASGVSGAVIVTEEVCARSQLLLWRKLLPPQLKLGFVPIKGRWDDSCIYSLQKNPRLWLLADIIRYWLFFFFGAKAGRIKESADE